MSWKENLGLDESELEGDEQKKQIKKDFLEVFSQNLISMEEACDRAGRGRTTIWKWRQADPEFDNLVEKAKRVQREQRIDKVEDSLFKRIVNGDAAASETIFWLKNNAPSRYSDVQKHVHQDGGELDVTINKNIVDQEDMEDESEEIEQ